MLVVYDAFVCACVCMSHFVALLWMVDRQKEMINKVGIAVKNLGY